MAEQEAKVLRKWPQRSFTTKGTLPWSLLPRNSRLSRDSLGAQIYYHRTFITIEEEQEEQASHQFAPSLMEGMTLWSNSSGMQVNYTVDTYFKDFQIIGPSDGSWGYRF